MLVEFVLVNDRTLRTWLTKNEYEMTLSRWLNHESVKLGAGKLKASEILGIEVLEDDYRNESL